jgi:hypothetical protein
MASRSHANQHAAHSMHSSRLATRAFFSDISKQPARHTFTHRAHASHFDSSTSINAPGGRTHSTPGNLSDVAPGRLSGCP